jgi:hypothetical protein
VYECVVDGQRMISDRPCGPEAQRRTLVVDQPDPRDVALQRQRLWQARQQAARNRSATTSVQGGGNTPSIASPASPNEAACRAVDQAIDNLNARMRQGYTSQEGEYLRQRWHELKEQRYELGCGR